MFFPLAALSSLMVGAISAPITAVTVFSDRARVVRTASVALSGKQSLEFPLLLDSVDSSTIRVEGSQVDVQRVDIAYVSADAFPADQARDLLAKIQKIDDDIAATSAQDEAYRQQLATFQRLTPHPETASEPGKPPPKLNPAGWASVLAFSATNEDKLEAHRRDLRHHLEDLGRQRGELVEQARIIGGAQRRSGYRVTAIVAGQGAGSVRLTYMVANARWYPTYDVTLGAEQRQVNVAFAGLVSQESGEDWTDAALTLSTAIPASALVFPKLTSWKIGEKERFIPTPVAAAEPPPPPPPEPPRALDLPQADSDLRARLSAVASASAPSGQAQVAQDESEVTKEEGKFRKKTVVNFEDVTVDGDLAKADDNGVASRRGSPAKTRALEEARPEPVPAAPVVTPAPMAKPMVEVEADSAPPASTTSSILSAPGAIFDRLAGGSASEAPLAPPPPPPPSSELGIAPPPSYLAPQFAANLPAALAGGYDLAFPSLRRETLKSGGGARRVALFAQQWPVTVEREVFPALNPEAFLIADLASPSPTPLPGGTANLFVGADPAGVAQLKLVSPGERFTLPLGLDHGVRPIRNVSVVEAEKGLISKDELTEYAVTTEIANPYSAPMSIRAFDQWPLTDQKEVEIHLLKTDPYAAQDPVKGSLEWRVLVPPRGKITLSFTYSIRRPKGWRMHQQ